MCNVTAMYLQTQNQTNITTSDQFLYFHLVKPNDKNSLGQLMQFPNLEINTMISNASLPQLTLNFSIHAQTDQSPNISLFYQVRIGCFEDKRIGAKFVRSGNNEEGISISGPRDGYFARIDIPINSRSFKKYNLLHMMQWNSGPGCFASKIMVCEDAQCSKLLNDTQIIIMK